MTPENEFPRLEFVQYVTGEEWRAITNSSRKNEVAGLRQKRCSLVDVSGGGSKVQCYNVSSKNQDKLDVVKQEVAGVNNNRSRRY